MASIERTPSGYRVRWREGGRNRAKLIGPRKADAITFKQELERSQRMGTLARLDMGKDTFEDFAYEQYWPKHALGLSLKTQTNQAYLLDKYLVPRFGGLPLAGIGLREVDDWLAEMRRKQVGTRAQQVALQLLVSILNKAVRWERLASNPASLADKPAHRKKPIEPPTPLQVERVRASLLQSNRQGDAVLVSALAYAGLRPQEALALTWDDIRDRSILVGPEHKTGHRSVDLWKPLSRDLSEWKLACGGATHLVFPSPSGQPLNWDNWRARIWHGLDWKGRSHDHPKYAGTGGVGIPGQTPYALRHLFCTLLLCCTDLTLYQQAKQAGHSARVHEDDYGHLAGEYGRFNSPEDAIRAARAEVHAPESQAESS